MTLVPSDVLCPGAQVAVKVDEGVKQLLKAEKSQKQSGMVLCITFLIVAVIVMLVVYLLKVILRF